MLVAIFKTIQSCYRTVETHLGFSRQAWKISHNHASLECGPRLNLWPLNVEHDLIFNMWRWRNHEQFTGAKFICFKTKRATQNLLYRDFCITQSNSSFTLCMLCNWFCLDTVVISVSKEWIGNKPIYRLMSNTIWEYTFKNHKTVYYHMKFIF